MGAQKRHQWKGLGVFPVVMLISCCVITSTTLANNPTEERMLEVEFEMCSGSLEFVVDENLETGMLLFFLW